MVSTTVATVADAHQLATALCDALLVACVHIESPCESHYTWQGRRHRTTEYTLRMITTAAQWGPLQTWMATHHPYECPQLLALPAQASGSYALWVTQQVS